MEMAFQGNTFALLGDHYGDEVETILARVVASAAKVEEPRRAVDQWLSNTKKPFAASMSPRFFNRERGRNQRNNGSERHYRNGVERYDGQWNTSNWQNNHGWNSFKRNNGYTHYNRAFHGLTHYDGQDNGYNRYEKINTGRSNDHKRNDTYSYQPCGGFLSYGYEVEDKLHQERQGQNGDSVGIMDKLGTEGNFYKDEKKDYRIKSWNSGRCRGYYQRQGQNGDSVGIMQKLCTESNFYKDEKKDYRIKNWNSGGYRGNYQRQGQDGNSGGIVEKWTQVYKKEEKEYRIRNSGSAGYRRGGADKGKNGDDGKISEDTNAGNGDVSFEASKEPESKKEKQHKVLSQEEAERLAEMELEEKRMTLKEYEKQLQEKRKVLESVKTEERKVTPDREFESMQIVEKKSKESISNTDRDKLKKKVAMDKDEDQVHKPIIPNFRHNRKNYSEKQSGRYIGYYSRMVRKADLPPSIQDATQFPALGGSIKA